MFHAWFGNGLADDVPHHWVTNMPARRSILTMPYYYHYDDQFFLLFPSKGTGLEHADSLFRNWRAEFDAQYRRGRHFHMTLHPYASGFGHRVRLLENFLQYVSGYPDIWNDDRVRRHRALARHRPDRAGRTADLARLPGKPELKPVTPPAERARLTCVRCMIRRRRSRRTRIAPVHRAAIIPQHQDRRPASDASTRTAASVA